MLRLLVGIVVAVGLSYTWATALGASHTQHGGSGLLDHSPERLSSTHCRGRRTTCLDTSTLLHCLPVFSKVVPAFIEACSKETPLCIDNKCVRDPRHRYRRETSASYQGGECARSRPRRDTEPELDLSGIDCNGKSTVCLNCTMTVHCIQSGEKFYPVLPTACSFMTPYCIDGQCGTKDPGRCQVQPPPKSAFKCAEGVEGYLPDPEDCSVYHFCAEKTSYDYKCASDTLAFNPQKAMCTGTPKNASCFQLKCTRPLEYVTYAPDPAVYALCKGAGPSGAILARCPDNHTFDVSAEQCVRTCLAEGRQPDPDNVNAYFECSRINGAWTVTSAVCPARAKFDATSERCVLR